MVTGTLSDPPSHYREIAGRQDQQEWYDTISIEMQGLKELDFAELVPRPAGTRGMRSRFHFERKVTGDKRCRLVAMDSDKRAKTRQIRQLPVMIRYDCL